MCGKIVQGKSSKSPASPFFPLRDVGYADRAKLVVDMWLQNTQGCLENVLWKDILVRRPASLSASRPGPTLEEYILRLCLRDYSGAWNGTGRCGASFAGLVCSSQRAQTHGGKWCLLVRRKAQLSQFYCQPTWRYWANIGQYHPVNIW